jgi:murein DD-endopeptidase MepM/ murein hydrolase activator NlpD
MGVFIAGFLASVAVSRGADTTPPPSTTTTVTTTAATTGTVTVPPPPTSTAATTTAPATTSPATTAAAATVTETTTTPRTVSPRVARHPRRCSVAAVAGLVFPRRPFRVVGLPGDGRAARSGRERRLVYPATGSVIAIRSVVVTRTRCRDAVVLRSVSLFRGAITAARVAIHVRSNGRVSTSVRRLRVKGRPLARAARHVRIGHWAVLLLRPQRAALSVRLVKRHGGLPAGTTLVVATARIASATASRVEFSHAMHRRSRRRRSQIHRPLKLTPPLGGRRYVFPVSGSSTFGDGYGAFRPDVSGNWHHGDDIFAAVGTPVVAVADGRLNRVGWEVIGGWRLWVRDGSGNEFYYAHLSGYSPSTLHRKRVEAGEVIGFVGNTGDAFTTPPHLHFEIHPHQLLSLGYDGAVDPTSYLTRWPHVDHARARKPVLPTLPAGNAGREARYVFRELLAARGFVHRTPSSPPKIRLPGRDLPPQPREAGAVGARRPAATATSGFPLALISASAAAVMALLAAGVGISVRSRR